MDLFIVPRNRFIDTEKAKRAVESSVKVVHKYWTAKNWVQINNTVKKSMFYGVVYDNEWFDARLVRDLQGILLYSLDVDMFSLFLADGEGEVTYQPRVFSSLLKLNPDIREQPLPFDHESLHFEKLLGGWLYYD